VGRPARGVAPFGHLGEEARVDCMMDIFILNEIWAQGKIHIFISTWLKYFTYPFVPVLAPHILSPSKVRKVC
jgi:hypothetical protein